MEELSSNINDTKHDYETLADQDTQSFLLQLYVTGSTPQSLRAIKNIKSICENKLKGRYSLEVINLYENPAVAKAEQIIAAPTLIKRLPLPLRRIIGDLSDLDKVLVGMGVQQNTK